MLVNVTLREEPFPQETNNLEYSQKAVKSVPVYRANINAGKGVKCSEIVDQEISESFEVNRQVIIMVTDSFCLYYISYICSSVA